MRVTGSRPHRTLRPCGGSVTAALLTMAAIAGFSLPDLALHPGQIFFRAGFERQPKNFRRVVAVIGEDQRFQRLER